MKRYEIKQCWKDALGEWVGFVGHIPSNYQLWYYIEDMDVEADDWDDSSVAPTKDLARCKRMCDAMNTAHEGSTMSQWQTLPTLPQSDTWAVIICSESFCGLSDMPMMAHYDLARDRFSVNGEEIPHGAIVKYFVLEVS